MYSSTSTPHSNHFFGTTSEQTTNPILAAHPTYQPRQDPGSPIPFPCPDFSQGFPWWLLPPPPPGTLPPPLPRVLLRGTRDPCNLTHLESQHELACETSITHEAGTDVEVKFSTTYEESRHTEEEELFVLSDEWAER